MPKLDLKKRYKGLYTSSNKKVEIVNAPILRYLMIDGKGAPEGKEAAEAIQALYPVAYAVKFAMKAKGKDYGVMPLEGLWWADDMRDFLTGKRARWKWTYMILQPEFVTGKDVAEALAKVKESKTLPGLDKLRLDELGEGTAAQLLHIGPYSDEREDIERIHEHIRSLGGDFDGHREKHHEIYLSDMRKVPPAKLKTILRQPFRGKTKGK